VDLIVTVELAYQKGAVLLRTLLATHKPILIWNTQQLAYLPEDADFDLVMQNSGMAGIPELTNSLLRAGRKFDILTSQMSDLQGQNRLSKFAKAAGIVRRLRCARVGFIGHTYEGMTDLPIDALSLRKNVGPMCWPIEPEEVAVAVTHIPDAKVKDLWEQDKQRYRFTDISQDALERSYQLALALEETALNHHVDALATFEQAWLADSRVGVIPSYGASRLNALGIPCAPEGDISTAVAMVIMQELAGKSTIVENYVMNFDDNTISLSHDGLGNPEMASSSDEVTVKPSIYYKGVNGFGASLEYTYAPGDVTILSLASLENGQWRLVAAEGRSLITKPRPLSAPQMMFRHSSGSVQEYCDRWCTAGATHHMAMAHGKFSEELRLIAHLLDIEVMIV
jgi:L-arabinose isomerase